MSLIGLGGCDDNSHFVSYIDKNRAPGSAEAFKAVGNAVAILTDVEKRKQYDLYGSEEQQHVGRSGYHRQTYSYGYTRGFEADVTAEELFNMFFGGGAFPAQNMYSSRNRRFQRQQNEEREVSSYARIYNGLKKYIFASYFLIFSLAMERFSISYRFYC